MYTYIYMHVSILYVCMYYVSIGLCDHYLYSNGIFQHYGELKK